MKPIYLYENGIKPWEQTTTVCDHRFATITVVRRSISELSDIWFELTAIISQHLPRCLKWRTVGHSIEGWKVQELKLVKKLQSDLSDNDYLGKNSETGVISFVKQLTIAFNEFDLNTISDTRYTVLLFLPDDEPNNSAIWEKFKSYDNGLEAKGMENSLKSYGNLIICRLYESDTHASLQFIGKVEQVNIILDKLVDLKIDRVEEREVAGRING